MDIERAPPPPKRRSHLGDRVADAADHYLSRAPKGFRDDCSGFVCAAFDRAGVTLEGSSRSMWDAAKASGDIHKRHRPAPGDVAFFDNTYDRNRNGRFDDTLTHVAVVLSVDVDGTIHLAHAGTSRGRTTLTMNLTRPHDHQSAAGAVLNDWLRRKASRDPSSAQYLSGELWRGFAHARAFE